MGQHSFSWLRNVYVNLLGLDIPSGETFEKNVEIKTAYLRPMHKVRLCTEATVLIKYYKKNHHFLSFLDQVTLVAMTHLLWETYGFSDLKLWTETIEYQNYHSGDARKKANKKVLGDENELRWIEEVLHATETLLHLELAENPKAFLIGWRPGETAIHEVCIHILEETNPRVLTTLYSLLLNQFYIKQLLRKKLMLTWKN
jgi:hypothetical protein